MFVYDWSIYCMLRVFLKCDGQSVTDVVLIFDRLTIFIKKLCRDKMAGADV